MNKKTAQALLLATAAASMFASGITYAGDMSGGEAKVHCGGVNACKGTSDCKTATNACKGQNSCKGHGFKVMTKAECDAAGGKVIE